MITHPARLLPGAVRNLGIAATSAPYVSFLAADCRAERGWAAGRLAAHRAGAPAVSGIMSPGPPAHPERVRGAAAGAPYAGLCRCRTLR